MSPAERQGSTTRRFFISLLSPVSFLCYVRLWLCRRESVCSRLPTIQIGGQSTPTSTMTTIATTTAFKCTCVSRSSYFVHCWHTHSMKTYSLIDERFLIGRLTTWFATCTVLTMFHWLHYSLRSAIRRRETRESFHLRALLATSVNRAGREKERAI